MLPAVHEVRYGPFTKTTYTLTAERLHVETRGGVGGASGDIPVAAITGFFALSRDVTVMGPRGAIMRSAQEITKAGGQLVVAWTQGNAKKSKRFTLDTDSATFQALLGELVRLRPDASLLALPLEQAHERLGLWSQEKQVKVGMVIFLGVLVIGGGIVAAVVGNPPPAKPAPRSSTTRPAAH